MQQMTKNWPGFKKKRIHGFDLCLLELYKIAFTYATVTLNWSVITVAALLSEEEEKKTAKTVQLFLSQNYIPSIVLTVFFPWASVSSVYVL